MDYDLDAQPGSHTVTGISNGWDYDRAFNAAAGAFTVAGNFPVNIEGDILGSQFKGSAFAVNNFTDQVRDTVSYFKLEYQDTRDPADVYRVLPMAYFKATAWGFRSWLPFGGIGVNEVFIPAASQYADELNNAQFFRVKRFFKLPDGSTYEQVWFYVSSYTLESLNDYPLVQEFTYGANQDHCIVKGFFGYFMEVDDTVFSPIKLTGIRSQTISSNGRRVTCNLDTVLRPGMMVEVDDDIFRAETVSYFVSPSDQYMEVFNYFV